jgi:hypothetical protein
MVKKTVLLLRIAVTLYHFGSKVKCKIYVLFRTLGHFRSPPSPPPPPTIDLRKVWFKEKGLERHFFEKN